MKKTLFLIALSILFLPNFSEARYAQYFYNHCDKDIEVNDFALVQTKPQSQNTPLVPADNGGWVAIYELEEVDPGDPDANPPVEPTLPDPLPMEVSGVVNSDRDYAVICENGQIVTILPTYFENETDEEKQFRLKFEIGFKMVLEPDGINETLGTEVVNITFAENNNEGEVVEMDIEACSFRGTELNLNDTNLEFQEIVMTKHEEEKPGGELVKCLTKGGSEMLGGLSYHELYVSIPRDTGKANTEAGNVTNRDQQTTAFGIQNYQNITSYNYAIFPPLEELSACNASSMSKLSVEDVRCLPLERQIEFKRYFLGLPELIQKLFDFDSDIENEEEDIKENKRPLLINYFNEIIPKDEREFTEAPSDQEKWLGIFLGGDGKYRYQKSFSLDELEQGDMTEMLISYYEYSKNECGEEGDDEDCWENLYRGEEEYTTKSGEKVEGFQCTVDTNIDLTETLGTPATGSTMFPQGCSGGAFPTLNNDQAALLERVGIDDPNHIKVQQVDKMNERANKVCEEYRSTEKDSLTMLQATNAVGVEITQFMSDLDARYEGFGACEKIQAINTMSGMMDRMLDVLGKEGEPETVQEAQKKLGDINAKIATKEEQLASDTGNSDLEEEIEKLKEKKKKLEEKLEELQAEQTT